MAITIVQSPATPNFSYNDLVYVLSSTNIAQPQFSFVMQITVDSTTFEYQKVPNPTQRGIFNISQIANDNLDWDLALLDDEPSTLSFDQNKEFDIVFLERYAVAGVLGDRNPTPTQEIIILKGFVDQDTLNLTAAPTIPILLSNLPEGIIRVHRDDFMGITTFDAGAIFHTRITVPAAPATTFNRSIVGVSRTFSVYDKRSELGEVHFAWYNRQGGIDYFTADQEGTEQTSVDKSYAQASPFSIGTTTSSKIVTFSSSVWKSQSVNYSTEFTTTFTKNTRWLSDDEDYVSGIFDSPRVHIQTGTTWRPVQITNSSYDARTINRQSGLHQYEIEYNFTNNKIGI